MTRLQTVVSGTVVAGALVVLVAQRHADATRSLRRLDTTLMTRPDPAGISVASMGFDELVADVTWVRTVLTFGERYDTDISTEWHEWLVGMVEVTATLDPHWTTVYQYGGAMLRVVGEIDASTAVFERCSDALPDFAWCPFAVGMNLYLNKHDAAQAAEWVARAARRPGAPAWWSAAAGRMKTEQGSLAIALHFIEDQLAANPREAERQYLLKQRLRLQHDILVETWAPACRERVATTGLALGAPADLATLGFVLPPNPRGDEWVVGRDGVVRSGAAEAERRRRVLSGEWALVRPLSR